MHKGRILGTCKKSIEEAMSLFKDKLRKLMRDLDKEFSLWVVKIEETAFWGRHLIMSTESSHHFEDVPMIIAYLEARGIKEFSVNWLENKRTVVVRKC